jgi:hypothetical protein
MDEYFKENPHLLQKVQELQQTQGQFAEELSPEQREIVSLKQELANSKKEFEEFRQGFLSREADQWTQQEIDKLQKQYPNHDWDLDDGSGTLRNKILKHAGELGTTNLAAAYRDFMWDNRDANSKAQALNQIKDKKRQEFKQGVVNQSGAQKPPVEKSDYNKSKGYNQLADEAVKELEAKGYQ